MQGKAVANEHVLTYRTRHASIDPHSRSPLKVQSNEGQLETRPITPGSIHSRGASRNGRGGIFSRHLDAPLSPITVSKEVREANWLKESKKERGSRGNTHDSHVIGRPGGETVPGLGHTTSTKVHTAEKGLSYKAANRDGHRLFSTTTNNRPGGETVPGLGHTTVTGTKQPIASTMTGSHHLHQNLSLQEEEEMAMEMDALSLQRTMLLSEPELYCKAKREGVSSPGSAPPSPIHLEDGDEADIGDRSDKYGYEDKDYTGTMSNSENPLAGEPLSPRSRYLDACLREGLNPRASMIVRKGFAKGLDLAHHGIGDHMGKVLAECLLTMPFLESIVLADNNLTDVSLGPLVQALVRIPTILHVDLSNNVVGDVASNTLSTYLGNSSCPLRKLVLRSADVGKLFLFDLSPTIDPSPVTLDPNPNPHPNPLLIDDFEATRFIQAIQANSHSVLEELDLTRNLLGGAEQLNTVMPELVTAGEAFAELIAIGSEGAEGGISDNRCKLKKLIIPWNMIRGDSAVEFCSQLRYNDSLIHLDIGYNAIGKDGARMIGDSLTMNKTLRYLDLTSNNIDCTGCFCITVGIIEVCVSSSSSSSLLLLLLLWKRAPHCAKFR